MEEDIKVAFDLLGGQPVDLVVFLEALLPIDMFLVLGPALLIALLKVDREPLPSLVALQVNIEESVVVALALIVELDPLGIGRLVPDDFTLMIL